jgi:hypothetical protein
MVRTLLACSLSLMLMVSMVHASRCTVKLGDTRVVIQQTKNGHGKTFVHLHHNETTALKAAQHIVKTEGGSVTTLIHKGKRNIVFHLRHQRYEFDPNRIFTDNGIKKTLMAHGHYSRAAHAAVKQLARQFIHILPRGKVVAVHNNNGYSIKHYFKGKCLHRDAKALHLGHEHFFRNFYLVTRSHDYERLKALHYNAVLQSRAATDDGSLSVFLAHRNYVNVEAGYGQLQAQIDMLKRA